jgi:hypothetical protein
MQRKLKSFKKGQGNTTGIEDILGASLGQEEGFGMSMMTTNTSRTRAVRQRERVTGTEDLGGYDNSPFSEVLATFHGLQQSRKAVNYNGTFGALNV